MPDLQVCEAIRPRSNKLEGLSLRQRSNRWNRLLGGCGVQKGDAETDIIRVCSWMRAAEPHFRMHENNGTRTEASAPFFTRTYLINGFVAGKPQNLHNENRRNVKIWLSSYSFT